MCIWYCPRCAEELGELNGWCEYCWQDKQIKIYNPRLREIRIKHIIDDGDKPMTPEEELFAEFFNKHINIIHPWVKDMDLLEIRAYRERMSIIAKEARAAVYAADKGEEEVLKKKNIISKPQGIQRNLNQDETSTNAINAIKGRSERMSKMEKVKKNLLSIPGMDPSFVESVMKNKNILDTTKTRLQNNNPPIQPSTEESKPIFNPFAKPSNPTE